MFFRILQTVLPCQKGATPYLSRTVALTKTRSVPRRLEGTRYVRLVGETLMRSASFQVVKSEEYSPLMAASSAFGTRGTVKVSPAGVNS